MVIGREEWNFSLTTRGPSPSIWIGTGPAGSGTRLSGRPLPFIALRRPRARPAVDVPAGASAGSSSSSEVSDVPADAADADPLRVAVTADSASTDRTDTSARRVLRR